MPGSFRAIVPLVSAAEIRRRSKAARKYAGLGTDKLAQKMTEAGVPISGKTIRNREAVKGQTFDAGELHILAAACDLPYEFFEIDFAQLPELMKLATRRADAPPPAPPGELGRRSRASQPKQQGRQPPETSEEQDSQRGTGGS